MVRNPEPGVRARRARQVAKAAGMLAVLTALGACALPISSHQMERALQNGEGVNPQLGDMSVGYQRHLHFTLGGNLFSQAAPSSCTFCRTPAWPNP